MWSFLDINLAETVHVDVVTGIMKRVTQAPAAWNFAAYYEIFPADTWVLILISLVLAFALMICNILLKTRNEDEETMALALNHFLCPQASTDLPSKVIFLSFSLCSLVCFAEYNADLTTYMTVQPEPSPLKSYQDILESEYEAATWKGGFYYGMFNSFGENSVPGRLLAKMDKSSLRYTECDLACSSRRLEVSQESPSQEVEFETVIIPATGKSQSYPDLRRT